MKNIKLHTILVISIFLVALSACVGKQPAAVESQQKAADFTVETIDGSKITLSEVLKDKNAVLVFWATWCPYCVKEIPAVEKFYTQKKDTAEVIGINLQESKEKVRTFAEKHAISYRIALDLTGNIGRLYNVRGIPTVVAIDKNRNIIYYGHSIEEMESKVK